MNIAALPSTISAMPIMRTSEASEGPGQDHDGDADDKGTSSSSGISAAPPSGMGAAVDMKA